MWQTIRSSVFGRHSHEQAYAAIVLSGGYEEAGDHGRFWATTGDVVLHERFEAHINRFSDSGAVVINLALPEGFPFRAGRASLSDPDSIVQLAEKSRLEASYLLLSTITGQCSSYADWPDELAAALLEAPSLKLGQWAERMALPPWAVSRGFRQVFGVSPEGFRARVRARQAWKSIQDTDKSLATIAVDLGFSDQAHMTRSVKQLTGTSPRNWRPPANGFKTN